MKLSINLNKIALLRNSRGNDSPSLQDYAKLAIKLGVDGLTLHPRPDHRHATSNDAKEISKICKDNNIEFNLEGNPFSLPEGEFLGFKELCNIACPNQITLVPDTLDQVTSDHGWQPGYLDDKLVAFLKDSNDMETSHASLQHIINIVSAQIPVAKVEFARCAGISVEQVGKELEEGESQADNEKAKLQEENDLRQQQIMEDFKRRQEAFFLEESSEDSSSDSDSSDEDEDDRAG